VNRTVVVGLCCLLSGSTIRAQVQKSHENAGTQATISTAGKDLEEVQGSWKPVEAVLEGQPMPETVVTSIRLKLEEGNYEVFVGDQADRGTYTLDGTSMPKSITIVGTVGPNAGRTFPAIYKLHGDTLRICYDLSGTQRPTEFRSTAGTKLYLVTYLRNRH